MNLASGNGYGTSPSFITVNQLYKFGPFISIANSEKKTPEGTNSIQRSQRSPWLSSSCIMSAGSWISWCRPFIRLSGAFFWPKYPSDAWPPGQVLLPFFKPSYVFDMVLKKNSAKNRGIWSWYAPKFRGFWENVAVIMERTNISFKHHLPFLEPPRNPR